MSVRQSLLAILDQGPCYGYQLRAEFDRRTGSTWSVNVGQIYNTLDRLERDGLARTAGADEQGHVFYEITSAGSAAVSSWLSSPVARDSGTVRDELAIKLALAATLPGVEASDVVAPQRVATQLALERLAAARETASSPSNPEQLAELLVLDSRVTSVEAELRWLEQVEFRLQSARKAGIAGGVPLATDAPKRGRPAGKVTTGILIDGAHPAADVVAESS